MHSCIYEGRVTHARCRPIEHRLQYSVRWFCLDLEEIPDLVGNLRLFSNQKRHPYSFRAADHGPVSTHAKQPDERSPMTEPADLADFVRDQIAATGCEVPRGRIRILTPLRQFGFYFSPLCLYFCNDEAENLHTVVAEVNNTPWRERHWYVLNAATRVDDSALRYRHTKQFHVSPFMDMDSTYDWRLTEPDEQLSVTLAVQQATKPLFQAGLTLQRRPLTDAALARSLIRFPVTSLQTLGAIHLEALRLWRKKCPFYVHPSKRPNRPDAANAMTL